MCPHSNCSLDFFQISDWFIPSIQRYKDQTLSFDSGFDRSNKKIGRLEREGQTTNRLWLGLLRACRTMRAQRHRQHTRSTVKAKLPLVQNEITKFMSGYGMDMVRHTLASA